MKDLLADMERFGDGEEPGTFDAESFFDIEASIPPVTNNPFSKGNLQEVQEKVDSKLQGSAQPQTSDFHNQMSSHMKEMLDKQNQANQPSDEMDLLTGDGEEEDNDLLLDDSDGASLECVEGEDSTPLDILTEERPITTVHRPAFEEEFSNANTMKIVEAGAVNTNEVSNTQSAEKHLPSETHETTIHDEVTSRLDEIATKVSPEEMLKRVDPNKANRVVVGDSDEQPTFIIDEDDAENEEVEDKAIYNYEQQTSQSQLNASYNNQQTNSNPGNVQSQSGPPELPKTSDHKEVVIENDLRIDIADYAKEKSVVGDCLIKSAYVNDYANGSKKKLDLYLSIKDNVSIKATLFNIPIDFTQESADSLTNHYTALTGKWDSYRDDRTIIVFGWTTTKGQFQEGMGSAFVARDGHQQEAPHVPEDTYTPPPEQPDVSQQPVLHQINETLSILNGYMGRVRNQHLKLLISAVSSNNVVEVMTTYKVSNNVMLNYLDQTAKLLQIAEGLMHKTSDEYIQNGYDVDIIFGACLVYFTGISRVDPKHIYITNPHIPMRSYDLVRDYTLNNQDKLDAISVSKIRSILDCLYTSTVKDTYQLKPIEALFNKLVDTANFK